MTTQAKLRGLGLAPSLALQVAGDIATGLVAAGNAQGNATPIYNDTNVVATTAAATGVILPANREVSDSVQVINMGANSLTVYPPVGWSINLLAANTGLAIASGKSASFEMIGATQFAAMLGA